jgi:hypothetical protein
MKRASYREAVAWIAFNDGNGDTERLDEKHCAYLTSTCLIADLFGVPNERVGKDIVRYRAKEDALEETHSQK